MSTRILIVEDDPRIATLVEKNLEAAGYSSVRAADGEAALQVFTRDTIGLVVLDVMIPGPDGLEVCRRIRKESGVPILMLTARTTESDKLLGFEVGADDYLTKPFSTAELVARVRALLRRAGRDAGEEVIEIGDLRIDVTRRAVEVMGTPVELTSLEFDLLRFMSGRPGRVWSREDLLRRVWGEDRVVDGRTIDSLVSRLRRKVERDAGHPRYIQTVWGAGYRFAGPS